MKKIAFIIMLVAGVLIVAQGCNKQPRLADDEKITKYELFYCADKDNKDSKYFDITIDFEIEEPEMVVGMANGKEIPYAVNNEEDLLDFLRETFSQSYNHKKDKKYLEEQRVIWSIKFKTDKDKYSFTGYDDYPTYWDELFEVLIETTEAETLDDFGFGDTDRFETYTLTEKILKESNEAFIKEIKYPYLENEKDYFKDINVQIEYAINEFDVFRMSDDSETQWSYWNTYEIVEKTYDNIIVKFNITAYPVGNPELKKEEYLLNIDLITETVTIEK